MPDDAQDYQWRFAASPLADPDDDEWIFVEGGGLRQPVYVRIARVGDDLVGSRLVVVGVLISNGRQVTSTDLRLPLQRILEQFERHYFAPSDPTAPRSSDERWYRTTGREAFDDWTSLMGSLPEAPPPPRGRGAAPPTDDELRSFAAVYVRELRTNARGAVSRAAEAFGMHRVTAHKWIQRCREAGILPNEETN